MELLEVGVGRDGRALNFVKAELSQTWRAIHIMSICNLPVCFQNSHCLRDCSRTRLTTPVVSRVEQHSEKSTYLSAIERSGLDLLAGSSAQTFSSNPGVETTGSRRGFAVAIEGRWWKNGDESRVSGEIFVSRRTKGLCDP